MSSLDRLRSFAESRSCPDHAIIQAGLTYGDARMLFTGIECMKAELAEAERQRDAARLELRALEWLTVNDHRPYTAGPRWDVVRSKSAPRVEHVFDSWSAAARALGWEG